MTRGIDHLVLAVRDLEKARTFYQRLGFTLTPRAQHPWGTANHLAQLNGCFLERSQESALVLTTALRGGTPTVSVPPKKGAALVGRAACPPGDEWQAYGPKKVAASLK